MGRTLEMHSAESRQIDNEQISEISPQERTQFRIIEADYGAVSHMCSEASPRFNCHGMTFASRRTGIFEQAAINQILQEDGYEEIHRDRVIPGDVILYYDSSGECEHSGLVVEIPAVNNLFVPIVRSKWGKYRELLHPGNNCPYDFSNVKYYRITRW